MHILLNNLKIFNNKTSAQYDELYQLWKKNKKKQIQQIRQALS